MSNRQTRRLQLVDFLVAPVQHIMKTPLLLKEILIKTEDLDEVMIIKAILLTEEENIRSLDDKMLWLKNYEHLLELARNLEWPSIMELDSKLFIPEYLRKSISKQVCDRIILSPRRKIIKEGQLNCWDSGKAIEMIILLFDDMLLLAKKKKPAKRRRQTNILTTPCPSGTVYKQPLSLDRISICDPSYQEAKPENSFVIVVVNRYQQLVYAHTLQAQSMIEKGEWVTALRTAQDNFKKSIQSSLFRDRSPPPRGDKPKDDAKEKTDTPVVADDLLLDFTGGTTEFVPTPSTSKSSVGGYFRNIPDQDEPKKDPKKRNNSF